FTWLIKYFTNSRPNNRHNLFPYTTLFRSVRDFCDAQPQFASQSGLERFHFCESVEVTVPFGRCAHTLGEFREGVAHLSHAFAKLDRKSTRLNSSYRTISYAFFFLINIFLL